MISISETALGRMPVVRGLYKGMKQIFETLFSQSGTSFRKVGLIEYPGKGLWSIVFISASPEGQVLEALPGSDDYVSCFLPCSPNPTTGFFLYLKKSEVVEVNISIDDAAKLVMSAGLIQPSTIALSNPTSNQL